MCQCESYLYLVSALTKVPVSNRRLHFEHTDGEQARVSG